MLSETEYGWTKFRLEGTGDYWLGYLTDVPFKWLDAAIHGLETMSGFSVFGMMEPNYFICEVCDDHSLITVEDQYTHGIISSEKSPVGIMGFCEELYSDILRDIGEFVKGFMLVTIEDDDEYELEMMLRRQELTRRLDHLRCLLNEKRQSEG